MLFFVMINSFIGLLVSNNISARHASKRKTHVENLSIEVKEYR